MKKQETKIVKLNPRKDGNVRATMKIAPDTYCDHKYVELDEDTRQITCNECKKVIDPFEFVLGWAKEERRQIWNLQDLHRQIAERTLERDELLKEVKSLKGKRSRAK